jgi:hypothetical protein
MFSGALDHLARGRFMSDSTGRLAVFPFGARKPGYYVEATDESKIKSLVKMYVVAGALVNLVGSLSSYALAQTQIVDYRACSMTTQIERFVGAYAICMLFFLILPALALWSVYKGAVGEVCSSLTAVGPDSVREMKPASTGPRTALIVAGAGALVLALAGLIVLVSSHR